MRRLRASTWLVILLVCLYGLSAFWTAAPASTGGPTGSAYNAGPSGVQALYTLLASPPGAGSVRVQTEPETGLDDLPVLLIVSPATDETAVTAQSFLQQAKAGSHLIILSAKADAWSHLLGITVTAQPTGKTALRGFLTVPDSSHHGVRSFAIRYEGPLARIKGTRMTDARITLRLRNHGATEMTVGLTRPFGRGSVTWLSLPALWSNAQILAADNLGVALQLLAPAAKRVGFVETVHGYTLTPGALSVLGPGVLYAFWFAVIALVLWLWSQGQRFGRIVVVPPVLPPAQAEGAAAVGRRARRQADWQVLWQAYCTFLQTDTSLPQTSPCLHSPSQVKSGKDFLRRMAAVAPKRTDEHRPSIGARSAAEKPFHEN